MKKKFFSMFTALIIIFSFIGVIPISDIEVSAKDITVFSQTDSRWGSHYYGYSDSACTQRATISSGGCGILAYVNAVYYLNGNFIDPITLADWSVNNGYRVNGIGTSSGLYSAFANKYGSNYNIAYNGNSTSYSTLKNHLQSGEVAIGGVPGHLMAIVDYDSSTGKFLILDSYKSSNRHTYSTGYTWETESSCKNTAKLNFSEFHFIKSNIVNIINLKVTAGTTASKTSFNWNSVANTKNYDLKIWKNKHWEGDPFYFDWNDTGTSHSVSLPPGHYEAYVDVNTNNGSYMSNVVTFDIKTCNHIYNSWTTTKAATCTADGTKTRKCSICGNVETASITKTGHKYTAKVVAPTCTDKGYTLHTCSNCGDSYKDNYVDPIVISEIAGDLNGDKKITVADLVILQNFIIKRTDTISGNADMNNDGKVNVFDVIIMKRKILKTF